MRISRSGAAPSASSRAPIHASVDGYVVLWESFGHVRGLEGFGRHVYVLSTNPHAEGGIDVVVASGNRVISFGPDRTLRLLTTAS